MGTSAGWPRDPPTAGQDRAAASASCNKRHITLPLPLLGSTAATPEISSVRAFIEPRQAMVRFGDLTRFREEEKSEVTEVFGNVAHRFSAYAKSGTMKGVPFEARA